MIDREREREKERERERKRERKRDGSNEVFYGRYLFTSTTPLAPL